MNPDIKKRWVEALRSGEYKQGVGQLRDENAFCCLGVLTDLAIKDGVCHWYDDPEPGDPLRGVDPEAGHLERWILDWAGLTSVSPEIRIEGRPRYLTDLNDGDPGKWRAPFNFSAIAGLIEEQL